MSTKITQADAVMYLRARSLGSTDDRATACAMIDAQRTACRRAAAELGVHVVREYAEHGGTGRIDKRPELRLMLDELRMLRDVRYVITISCDRLWRQVADQAAIQFETDAAGTQLVFANELLGKPPQQREETSV